MALFSEKVRTGCNSRFQLNGDNREKRRCDQKAEPHAQGRTECRLTHWLPRQVLCVWISNGARFKGGTGRHNWERPCGQSRISYLPKLDLPQSGGNTTSRVQFPNEAVPSPALLPALDSLRDFRKS